MLLASWVKSMPSWGKVMKMSLWRRGLVIRTACVGGIFCPWTRAQRHKQNRKNKELYGSDLDTIHLLVCTELCKNLVFLFSQNCTLLLTRLPHNGRQLLKCGLGPESNVTQIAVFSTEKYHCVKMPENGVKLESTALWERGGMRDAHAQWGAYRRGRTWTEGNKKEKKKKKASRKQ